MQNKYGNHPNLGGLVHSGQARIQGPSLQAPGLGLGLNGVLGLDWVFSLLPSKDKPALQGNFAEQSKDHMTALVAACYGRLQCPRNGFKVQGFGVQV